MSLEALRRIADRLEKLIGDRHAANADRGGCSCTIQPELEYEGPPPPTPGGDSCRLGKYIDYLIDILLCEQIQEEGEDCEECCDNAYKTYKDAFANCPA